MEHIFAECGNQVRSAATSRCHCSQKFRCPTPPINSTKFSSSPSRQASRDGTADGLASNPRCQSPDCWTSKHCIRFGGSLLTNSGPGSGKGTQCERLAKEFKLTHLSTGDLLREQVELQTPVGIQAAALMKEGKMVPMSIMINLLKDQIDQNMDSPGFLIDGFPRAMDQALEFEKTIGTCKTVIAFRCSLSVLEARLLERGKTSGRADDNIETIKKRFNTFENQSMPVIEHFKLLGKCIEISSEQAIEQVYQEASAVFSKAIFEGENIVFVLGGPGSGKGTQCDEIVSKLGWAHLSTGDLLRAEVKKGTDLGKSLEADMKEGKMISVVLVC